MIAEITCSQCGKKCSSIRCGNTDKSLTKRARERQSNYICVECKRKGTGEFRNSFANHQQHEIYFNEEE